MKKNITEGHPRKVAFTENTDKTITLFSYSHPSSTPNIAPIIDNFLRCNIIPVEEKGQDCILTVLCWKREFQFLSGDNAL